MEKKELNPKNIREIVHPGYIRERMKQLGLKQVDLVNMTGADKTNINAWVNGTRTLSQPVKAMFFYLFEYLEISGTKVSS